MYFEEADFPDGEINAGDLTGYGTYFGLVELHGFDFMMFDAGGGYYNLRGTVADPNSYVPQDGFAAGDIRNTALLACFLTGTAIATPDGPRAVETLLIGDLVLTADGRAVPVRWVGRQTAAAFFTPRDRGAVHVSAGALGDHLPKRDLKLTADHALMLDGVLVQAGALVNGATIRFLSAAETGAQYTVWHVETEGHEVILAEGCPAETFIDNVTRGRFDNYAEYVSLYGEEGAAMAELEAPRIKSARQLPVALRARIAGIAGEAVKAA